MVRGGVYGFLIRHFVAIAGVARAAVVRGDLQPPGRACAHSLGRLQLLRLPAVLVSPRRHDARRRGAHASGRGISRVHRDQTLARDKSLGESSSDGAGHPDRAVLLRRPRADPPAAHAAPDGFSFYYQHAAGLAGLVYLLAGLAVVRRLLLRHFSPAVALATLATRDVGNQLVPLRGLRQRLQPHLLVLPHRGARRPARNRGGRRPRSRAASGSASPPPPSS